MCAWCRHARGRFEWPHGGVLNLHTGFFSGPHRTQHHRPHHGHHMHSHTTTSHGDRESERERQRKKTEREREKEEREDKTRQEKRIEEKTRRNFQFFISFDFFFLIFSFSGV